MDIDRNRPKFRPGLVQCAPRSAFKSPNTVQTWSTLLNGSSLVTVASSLVMARCKDGIHKSTSVHSLFCLVRIRSRLVQVGSASAQPRPNSVTQASFGHGQTWSDVDRHCQRYWASPGDTSAEIGPSSAEFNPNLPDVCQRWTNIDRYREHLPEPWPELDELGPVSADIAQNWPKTGKLCRGHGSESAGAA